MRHHLRGIAAIRRKYLGSDSEPQILKDCTVYDRWGDPIPTEQLTITRRKIQTPGDKLGKGNFSSVYGIDDNRVLKITTHPTKDMGYQRYVDLILQHQDNPYFPKVYYRGTWAGNPVYVLERLTECDSWNDPKASAFCNYVSQAADMPPPACPWLSQAMSLLVEHNLLSDLGTRNLMRRGEQLVITDPAAEGF